MLPMGRPPKNTKKSMIEIPLSALGVLGGSIPLRQCPVGNVTAGGDPGVRMLAQGQQQRFEGADAQATTGAVIAARANGKREEAADAIRRIELVHERCRDGARGAVLLVVGLVRPRLVRRQLHQPLPVTADED